VEEPTSSPTPTPSAAPAPDSTPAIDRLTAATVFGFGLVLLVGGVLVFWLLPRPS
jgi:hypothetical protein